MNKISGIALAFMLFASLSFAWTTGYAPPSCQTQYTVNGANFTYAASGTPICGDVTSACYLPINITSNISGSGAVSNTYTTTSTVMTVTGVTGSCTGSPCNWGGSGTAQQALLLEVNVPTPVNVSYSAGWANAGGSASAVGWIKNETGGNITFSNSGSTSVSYIFNITRTGASLFITNGTSNLTTSTSYFKMNVSGDCVGGQAYGTSSCSASYVATFPAALTLSNRTWDNSSSVGMCTGGRYYGFHNGSMLLSDFKTGSSTSNTSQYCQALLYFNNPYYGNVQLIPAITYIPGTNAYANFINSTTYSAYIPNNSISYIYDSITSGWYIVPATVCTLFTTIGSVSTLQYNPTGVATGVYGTVPIDLTSITGACTFNSITRGISCSGADSSSTLTSLNLTSFASGSSVIACTDRLVGSAGALNCTLPNVNGTYQTYFYGTDVNLMNYLIYSDTYIIGIPTTTTYGRDGWIAAILIVVVASTIMTSSIAVSMVLGCFGLFVAVIFGIIPIGVGLVAALFAVVALALAYRLKV
jgi:hypothetical protein